MTAREARDAAKLVAAEYVEACCPWATAWRVTSSRPKAELGWGHHRAMLAVKMIDGAEKAVVEIDRAASEEAALTMLGQEMLRRIARGVREPDPYEATCRAAFGPPPDGWVSWSSMPSGIRQWYAAQRVMSGAGRFRGQVGTVSTGAASNDDLRALGLRDWPTADALTAAWRETAKRTHPDAGGSEAAFVAARAAYERLRGAT